MTVSAIEAAYRDTVYRVIADGGCIDLRIGRRHPRLDRMLMHRRARHWAFLTAWNPASSPLPPWRNAQRQRRLLACLRPVCRVTLYAVGLADRGDWREASVFVAPCARGRALRLGRQFGQAAVVLGVRGGKAELAWCKRRLIA